jgi:hypothetical protein
MLLVAFLGIHFPLIILVLYLVLSPRIGFGNGPNWSPPFFNSAVRLAWGATSLYHEPIGRQVPTP